MIERSLREHRATMQHRHLAVQSPDEVHVVFDHDNRVTARDGFQQLGRPHGLGVGHAGRRLVDEKELGVLREQHADLEPLLLAVAEAAGKAVAGTVEANQFEELGDPLALPAR